MWSPSPGDPRRGGGLSKQHPYPACGKELEASGDPGLQNPAALGHASPWKGAHDHKQATPAALPSPGPRCGSLPRPRGGITTPTPPSLTSVRSESPPWEAGRGGALLRSCCGLPAPAPQTPPCRGRPHPLPVSPRPVPSCRPWVSHAGRGLPARSGAARSGAAGAGQCRAMVPTLVLRLLGLLLLLLLGHGISSGPEEELAHVEQYEMVMPRRVLESRGKRDLSASPSTYPDHVLYSIQAEGRDYLLHLEKNRELLGQHYTETHYLADGTEITEKPDVQDHCFYQGHVVGYTDSAASISICGGLR
ncbi:Disintegrin and metalloproteinase domain-containing protein 8 isoform X1 [Aix galericulata]|nr:Disintegrin and metalloproteinase domain-containing protein 8 isoform X1 [Aix galericulata]